MTEALTNTALPITTTTQPATKIPDLNFKEIVTAAIALAIVTTMIAFLWWGFNKGKDLEENQKYIIGIALSLAGTVTGYYFGRVPAEKRADTAERAENDAKDGKAKADAKLNDAKQTLERVLPSRPEFQAQKAMDNPGGSAWVELDALRGRLS
jgi:H+/gluconate symporter-like permease